MFPSFRYNLLLPYCTRQTQYSSMFHFSFKNVSFTSSLSQMMERFVKLLLFEEDEEEENTRRLRRVAIYV